MMEAPLYLIGAWTLFYSCDMALAEPDYRSNDNRSRLFFLLLFHSLHTVAVPATTFQKQALNGLAIKRGHK